MNGSWAELDVRDEVVDYVRYWSDKTDIKATKMIRWIKITRSKYYDWLARYIVHWEIREAMKESDVEIILQRAREKFPDAKLAAAREARKAKRKAS